MLEKKNCPRECRAEEDRGERNPRRFLGLPPPRTNVLFLRTGSCSQAFCTLSTPRRLIPSCLIHALVRGRFGSSTLRRASFERVVRVLACAGMFLWLRQIHNFIARIALAVSPRCRLQFRCDGVGAKALQALDGSTTNRGITHYLVGRHITHACSYGQVELPTGVPYTIGVCAIEKMMSSGFGRRSVR